MPRKKSLKRSKIKMSLAIILGMQDNLLHHMILNSNLVEELLRSLKIDVCDKYGCFGLDPEKIFLRSKMSLEAYFHCPRLPLNQELVQNAQEDNIVQAMRSVKQQLDTKEKQFFMRSVEVSIT